MDLFESPIVLTTYSYVQAFEKFVAVRDNGDGSAFKVAGKPYPNITNPNHDPYPDPCPYCDGSAFKVEQ